MISCQSFRATFEAQTEDPQILEHLRACDACLDFAAGVDPDVMFRALGGGDLIPPGGVDLFVDDVMREVRLRDTEHTVDSGRTLSWPRRLAVAATIAAGVAGATLVWQFDRSAVAVSPNGPMVSRSAPKLLPQIALATKPVVETYDSDSATIVEIPTEETSDVKIVMVFDERLPADL